MKKETRFQRKMDLRDETGKVVSQQNAIEGQRKEVNVESDLTVSN